MKNYGYKNLAKQEKLSKEGVQEFWESPPGGNQPVDYLKGEKRSEYLVKLIGQYLSNDARILEIGCNVGRNLNSLYNAGYLNLSGIEINSDAIGLMKVSYPEMSKNTIIINKPVEEALPGIHDNAYDLVFTMAVLEHIHSDNEFIFNNISMIAKEYIITIEDEKTDWSERHFTRNYKEVFVNKVWKQIFEMNCEEIVEIQDDRFWVRVFKREICNG